MSGDRDLPDCPVVAGTHGTEIARRMLFKSVTTDTPGEYKCHSAKTFQLFSPKEKASMGKISLFVFRGIAKTCPPILGKFDAEKDSLIWELPLPASDDWQTALQMYANTSLQELRHALTRRGPQRGRSSSQLQG